MSIQVFGLAVSRGVAIGRAVLIASSRVDVAHYFVAVSRIDTELQRLVSARVAVVQELSTLQRDLPHDAPHELAGLLDVHLMLLQDESVIAAVNQWIVERHYNAEWALSAQLEVIARQFDEMEDEYLRERKADMEQVTERLLRWLSRGDRALQPALLVAQPEDEQPNEPLILVAGDISPADMLQFKHSVFKGFVTDVGGKTSHTAIVARSLDIAAVVGAREASRLIRQDDWVVIDGDAGVVVVNPSPIILEEYRFRQQQAELGRASLDRLRHTPAITLDGETIELLANIELPADAAASLKSGAMGVGLFRTEFLFMNRGSSLPNEEEQFAAYREAVEAVNGMSVTIRTVDIGADKPLERMTTHELRRESALNPVLGLRAIRWSLSEPHMFRQQLRAILRASQFGQVRILIPMVAQHREIQGTLDLLAQAKQQLREAGKPYADVKVGAMIEIPAAALMTSVILQSFDFVSIGTNDLIQYTLAIDRGDEQVAHLYDPWHPAVLQLIANSIAAARAVGKPVSVCGEMAGDAAFTELLLAMGLRSFSMHPAQIASIKQRVLRADTRRLAPLLPQVLAARDPQATASRLWGSRSV